MIKSYPPSKPFKSWLYLNLFGRRLIRRFLIPAVTVWVLIYISLWAGYQLKPLAFMPEIKGAENNFCIQNKTNKNLYIINLQTNSLPIDYWRGDQLPAKKFPILMDRSEECGKFFTLLTHPIIFEYQLGKTGQIFHYTITPTNGPGYGYDLDIKVDLTKAETSIQIDPHRDEGGSTELLPYYQNFLRRTAQTAIIAPIAFVFLSPIWFPIYWISFKLIRRRKLTQFKKGNLSW
ncbi:MAG: hypothetical protein AB7G80_09655 [Dongiaceae bacterium]